MDAWKTYIHLPPMPDEVFADPGRHGWYFREKKPDSVARFVRAELAPPDPLDDPRVKALVEALRESQLQIDYLHGRLGEETGSGNAVRSRNVAALAALKGNNHV